MESEKQLMKIRDEEIYNEFLTGKYTLRELAEMFDLHKSRIARIIDKFLKKK